MQIRHKNKINISNNIKIINGNVLYNNIMYFLHPIYKKYYGNSANINNIIYKTNNEYFLLYPKTLKRDKYRTQISCDVKNIILNQTTKTINTSRFLLDIFKFQPSKEENECAHFDDLPENNDISNLLFLSRSDNNKLMGINCSINKNLYILLEHKLINDYNLKTSVETNNVKCLKVNHPYMNNVYISCDGTTVFENNIMKNIYTRYHGPNNYKKVWINKTDINVHHLMGWAKYGYINLKVDNKRFLHVNDISTDCSYNNIILGTDKDNGISQKENTLKYKEFRRNLKQTISESEYENLINRAVNMLPPKYKEFYDQMKQKLEDSNKNVLYRVVI